MRAGRQEDGATQDGALASRLATAERERDIALLACQAAFDSIRRFPGSLHDRAMAKLEKALFGKTQDFRDPDITDLEAQIKALTSDTVIIPLAVVEEYILSLDAGLHSSVRDMLAIRIKKT